MANILDLKLQLRTTKKWNLSCAQFLQQMQLLTDQLRNIGIHVSDYELVLYGLGFEYENFVTALSMRPFPPSMAEFTSLFLAYEARLLTNLRSISSSTVHLTTQSDNSSSVPSDNVAYYTSNYRPPNSNNSRGRSSHGRGYNQRGRGRGRQTNSIQD